MTVKQFCDGPNCEKVVRVAIVDWLYVQAQGQKPGETNHFCSWGCLADFAIAKVSIEAQAVAAEAAKQGAPPPPP